ncbi:Fe-S cluster assembly protein SufD [Nitrobacter sp. NHB1]|uniref:Fe-S cluster assembly protein SufD n=1 Tax=Nitrobacter sp. NHB1 TaxID=3119830 RepID=UPI002FFEDA88
MDVALAKTDTGSAASEAFAVACSRLPGAGKVAAARQKAFKAYESLGLPHRRVEDWKYTDLRVLMREVLPLAAAPDQAALAKAGEILKAQSLGDAYRFVLVDGVFVPQLSDVGGLEDGLRARSFHDVLGAGSDQSADLLTTSATTDVMVSLNAAMTTDGVVIEVGDRISLAKPIHVIHVTTVSSASAFTRSRLTIGKAARATLIESFVAADDAKSYQTHDALIVAIGDGADLAHIRLTADAGDAANISSAIVTVGGGAKLNLFNLTNGGRVSRYQVFATLEGEGSDVFINGVSLLKDTQHADMTLVVDHAVPHCTSREVFRAVVDDRAHSVFQGKIIVRPDAQKTDGKMMTRALLLSDGAEADSKPELEIFADDVTCGHGATIGALDDSLLFYLRARGLSEKEAQALLIQAFVGEAIESIADDGLRDVVIGAAERWLAERG